MQNQVNACAADAHWEATRDNNHEATASSSSLPPIATAMLPRLVPASKSAAPADPQLQKHELSGSVSRLPMPRQQPNPSCSMFRFPSLVKPQHRIPPLSKCNQEDEQQKERHHSNGDLSARRALKGGGGGNNGDDEDEDAARSSASASTWGPAPGSLTATRPVGDKNRDFIRELEEKKRKQKEDQARQERRKQKLQEKLSRKILEEAAQARQKQQSEGSEPEENGQSDPTGDDQPHEGQSKLKQRQADERAATPESSRELRERKEKLRRQQRLLREQQALLEQIQTKKKEKQEEAELEKEKERRKQEKVKKAILDAIYDANSRLQEQEEGA